MNYEKLICPICKKEFRTLNSHIHFKHKLSTEEFLSKYPNTKLVSESIKQEVSNSCKKSGCGKWMKGYKLTEERKKEYSKKFSGVNNPFYGKKHSNKTRKLMSDNHADFTGDNNPLVKWLSEDEKNKEEYSRIMKEKWKDKMSDEEYRKKFCEKVSKAISKTYLNGFNPYTNCEKGWFESVKFKNKFYYCSSYEKRFLEFCEMSYKIVSLQRVPFMIPYMDKNGVKRNYVADFLANQNILIEIKPESMLGYNNNEEKIKFAKEYCLKNGLEYKVLMEKELNNLDETL